MNISLHTWAWITWLAAALVALSTTRNPLYIALILLCLAVVILTLSRRLETAPPPVSPFKFGLIVVALSALFNTVISHFGQTVLFYLPEKIPVIGGPITAEALVYGAINGLVLTGIFWAFTALNQALPTRQLIRLIPRAFYPLAVVTSIAITFIPTTIRQQRQIREAQAVRGNRMRGLGDWIPLIIPLLVGGLERAMQLAEAMTARGFASTSSQVNDTRQRVIMAAGLVILLVGWLVRLNPNRVFLGTIMLITGIFMIVMMLYLIGQQAPRTTYARQAWTIWDTLVVMGALIVLGTFLLPLPWIDKTTLAYPVYPTLSCPIFDPLISLAILGLLIPAVVVHRTSP
jgi:energy-coupling factor transport system permease protein